jgi:hypothetical protein
MLRCEQVLTDFELAEICRKLRARARAVEHAISTLERWDELRATNSAALRALARYADVGEPPEEKTMSAGG